MNEIITIFFSIIAILIISFIFNVNLKKIKKIIKNNRIKELIDRFPDNKEICIDMLKILKNEKVNIKQNEDSKDKTSVYIVITDTIYIASIKDIYTRIQTIAHECIHSVQDKKMLLFNFIYSNIYNLYFLISIVLTICGIFRNTSIQIIILLIMGILGYVVRSYLEIDAMIKAKYLANEYMKMYVQKNRVCTEEEIEEITKEYESINKIGIPTYNFILLLKMIIRVIIYSIISIICFNFINK